MTTSWTQAYQIGRAIAEIMTEKVNQAATEVLSELGKLDAERREATREFLEEVNARVAAQQGDAMNGGNASGYSYGSGTSAASGRSSQDLQATIDDLRAEIAEVRAELQKYRSTL